MLGVLRKLSCRLIVSHPRNAASLRNTLRTPAMLIVPTPLPPARCPRLLCCRPYVLREASRPFKNLLEYHGITASRLEMMEARLRVSAGWLPQTGCLKTASNMWRGFEAGTMRCARCRLQLRSSRLARPCCPVCHLSPQPVSASTLITAQEDILAEAAAHGGRLLVTREAEADSRYASNGGGGAAALARQVVEAYEPVAGPEAVQTPKQVWWRARCWGVVQAAPVVAPASCVNGVHLQAVGSACRARAAAPHPSLSLQREDCCIGRLMPPPFASTHPTAGVRGAASRGLSRHVRAHPPHRRRLPATPRL